MGVSERFPEWRQRVETEIALLRETNKRIQEENKRLGYCKVALDEIMKETNFISIQAVRSYVGEMLDMWVNVEGERGSRNAIQDQKTQA